MKERRFYFIPFFILLTFFLSVTCYASTTCEVKDCKITITLKIIFVEYPGVSDINALMEEWKNNIEDVWNGDGQVTGDCKCPVSFKVETSKTTYDKEDCKPPPPGSHCVKVTNYNNMPPKDTQGNFYIAYMYPPGVAKHGQSICGWWSDFTNNNPDGNDYNDAAHEAGHMMGLDDKEGNGIMTHTLGENSKPTQENIDAVVKNICGLNACPDRCCCGNGVIDDAKGETCDPMLIPDGCDQNESCCIICCNCFAPNCNPEEGSYAGEAECEIDCELPGKCYYNYKTGCWDCVKPKITEHKPVYNESKIKNCNHPGESILDLLQKLIGFQFPAGIPFVCPLPEEYQLVHLYITDDAGEYSFAISWVDCSIVEVDDAYYEPPFFPTMEATTDTETLEEIVNGAITLFEAWDSGRISFVPLPPPLP